MGGGGFYYDRDVTDRRQRTRTGYSRTAQRSMSSRRIDPALRPANRRLTCPARSPLVFAFDVTGSMGGLPRIIFDKMPMLAGQIAACGYLDDPSVSLAAVGDIVSDRAPLQIADFSPPRQLDGWLKRIWLERGGGGNAEESYELAAWFYAYLCDLPNAATPIMILTGDQKFNESIPYAQLTKLFGRGCLDQATPGGATFIPSPGGFPAERAFRDLLAKFKGNVFMIWRHRNCQADAEAFRQWQGVLGDQRVISLPANLAVGDVALGLIALASGARDLAGYCQDMSERGQTGERVSSVRSCLGALAERLAAERIGAAAGGTSGRESRLTGSGTDTSRDAGRLDGLARSLPAELRHLVDGSRKGESQPDPDGASGDDSGETRETANGPKPRRRARRPI